MIDLHTHTNASDGELSPVELVNLAAENGLTALAITDHDTLAGLSEGAKVAAKRGIRFITGFETDVDFAPGEFHLLGFGFTENSEPLEDFLKDVRHRRQSRNEEIIALMNRQGLKVTLPDLNELAGGDVIGRMHFSRWLINTGHAKNIPDSFKHWLGQDCPFYVPKNRPCLEKAINAIHDSGGMAVLAHPLSLWISWGRLAKYIPEWKEIGLDGIEAWHPGASKREAARFEELASLHGLFVTGGSDFHGPSRPNRRLGYSSAGLPLDESFLEPFDVGG